ncbi:MAG TPA: hypothetical protein PLN69_09365 [bacterium]|nr:hypothetical protein [bacterium]
MEIDFNNSVIKLFSGVSLVLFLFLSFRVVKEDIAAQKIPNALVLKYLKAGLVLIAGLLLYGLIQHEKFAVNYVKIVMINTSFALVSGYALWYFDLFSPGDSKYFTLAALFIPLESYTYQFVPFFPSLIILINAYVIAFLMMFTYTLYLIAKKYAKAASQGEISRESVRAVQKKVAEKMSDPIYLINIVGTLLYIMSLILIIRAASNAIQNIFNFPPGNFTVLTVLILYFVVSRLQSLMRNNRIVAVAAYFIFAGVIFFQYFILGQNIILMIKQTVAASFFMIIFIPIARKIIDIYYETRENNTVESIRMGVVLNEETVEIFKTDWGVEVPALVPLTDDQSQSIKEKIPNNEKIRSVEHITFGPFIFIGAVFTLLFRYTIIHYFQGPGIY